MRNRHTGWGGAQSVERWTPGEEVPGSIPAVAARSYWLGRCQCNVTGLDKSHGLPVLSRVWQHIKLSDVSLGTRPRYSLVIDEDVKKPNKRNKQTPHTCDLCPYYNVSVRQVFNNNKKITMTSSIQLGLSFPS